MEYKVDDIITYNEDDKTIYLKVIPTKNIGCQGCYFYKYKYPCSTLRNIIGNCTKDIRTDKQIVIFKQVKNNIMEYKIGDTFCLEDGTKLEVVKATCNCRGCYFFNDKDDKCSRTKDIICSAPRRTDKEFVIFKQIKDNNNMKKKTTIDIYVVIQTHKQYRSFCSVFTSFEEADARFEGLLNHYKIIHKVQPKGWTTKSIPSQIKVSIIGDITLYLCKETKEIEISEEIKEPIVDKPEFKPFFCANNCFKESIKHTPFGILKDSTDKYYTILDISEDGISVLSGNHSVDTISFKFASTFLKYVDGSPFGWL